ncbi:glycosyltransferase [Lebetimonas sp. JH369]|uniref:glycosyltransferase n=1 Tax=Lebetimonas sp. JH369 TaxID=990069 RepID=UPI0004630848|nr:glycosyltransferase [Lebetimonas sp. JH369]
MNIVLAIRSLDIGGAERQFIELVKHIDKIKFDITVCTMYGGVQENIIKNILGIRYINLEKKGRYDFSFYFKYKKLLNEINPDVIYSFLGEMNLFSLWCKPKQTKLIWGFRASNMDMKKYGKVAELLFWLQKKFSGKVDKIIANSYASIEFHKQEGFFMNNAIVIHNGIDTNKFKRDIEKRKEFRKKYNLNKNDIAIGIVARIDYMKGYPVFSKAAKKILENYKNVKIFAIGGGNVNIKKECEEILGDYNNTKFIWLGKKTNVEDFYSGFDIASSSSSFGEGFSNSIAEAMSCEAPCVVTDVGDSALIVGDCGIVVKPNSVEDLYQGIDKMINRDFKNLGKKSRKRIIENFSIKNKLNKTEEEIIKCVE